MSASVHPLRSRRRAFFVLLAVALLGIGAGVSGTMWLKSPQQAAADAAPPGPTTLTAQVERRVLAETVTTRGVVKAASSLDVTPSAPASGGAAVITGVRVGVGSTFGPVQVLVEVAGRPLFALPGAIPMYRDLRPGFSGDDVKQLQQALKAQGFDPHESNGTFGPGTKTAVTALYQKLGHTVPTTGTDDAKSLDSANQAVTSAQRAVDAAKDTLNRLLAAPPQEPPKPGDPDPIAQARLTLKYATEDQANVIRSRDQLVAASGPMVPMSELMFLPSFPARVDALKASVGAAVAAPMITVSAGALVVQGSINPAQRPLLDRGQRVEIASEATGITASGTIDSIGDLHQDTNTGTQSYPLTVVADGGSFDPRLAGQDVRLNATAASSNGPVLAVPVSALSAGPDGRTFVQRRSADGAVTRVAVTAGMSAAGFVAVTPAGEPLREGDEVIVGTGGSGSAVEPTK